jgi:hypothetical protein
VGGTGSPLLATASTAQGWAVRTDTSAQPPPAALWRIAFCTRFSTSRPTRGGTDPSKLQQAQQACQHYLPGNMPVSRP